MGKAIRKKIKGMNPWAKIGLVTIFSLLLCIFMYQGWYKPRQAGAAISQPTAWASQYANTAYPAGAVNASYTISAGTNRLLLVAIASRTNGTAAAQTVSVTYGGQALTLAQGDAASSSQQHTYLYYLNDAGIAAAVGTSLNVTITGGTAGYTWVYASVFAGVNQTTPFTASRNFNGGSTASTSVGPFATALTENTNDQPIEVILLQRSASGTTARTITTWASTPEAWGTGTGASIPVNVSYNDATWMPQMYITHGAIPASNITTDTSTHTASNTAYSSMTGISLQAAPPPTQTLDSFTDNSANATVPTTDLTMATIASTATNGGAALTATSVTIGGTVALADVTNIKVFWGATQVASITPTTLTNQSITLTGAGSATGNLVYKITLASSAAGKTFSLTANSVTGSTGGTLTLPQSTATRTASAAVSQTLDSFTDNSANATVPATDLAMATIASTATGGGAALTATSVTIGGTVALADVTNIKVFWGATQVASLTPTTLTNQSITLTGAGSATGNLVYKITLASSAAGKTFSLTANSVTGSTGGTLTLPQSTATRNATAPINSTAAGTPTLSQATPTSLTVTMPYTNDSNANNTYTVDYGPSSTGPWTNWVTAAAHTASPYTTTITGLTTGSTYYARCTFNDADTVTGTNPQVAGPVTLVANSSLTHNSLNLSSTKWPGGWGVSGGKYGTFTCTTCHTMKAGNIKRIKSTFTAPFGNWSSSNTPSVSVSFINLTSMGHDENNHTTSNRVCEACHSRNKYHNYNTAKNTGGISHNNGLDCVGCHSHNAAFKGAESKGGQPCTACHNSGKFAAALKGTNGYHHYLQSTDTITYGNAAQPALIGGATDTNRNCLMCHVDHDIFRPDINLNAGSGRGKNLRADISTTPSAANTASYANTDFLPDATKNGGICMSCHRTSQTNLGYTQPDGSLRKPAIPYPDTVQKQVFVYMSSAHNYTVSSTFSATGTNTFSANCSKCHNDTMNPKSGYNGQGTSRIKFGNHTTSIPQMLTTFGAAVTSSQKADYCFKCHGNVAPFSTTTPNINVYLATDRFDWYSTSMMIARTKNIAADFNDATLTHKHQVQLAAYAGNHHAGETRAELSANKHVTCDDCHNHHGSKKGLHIQGGARNLSPALTGAMGVTPPTWTAWSTARAASTTVTWPDAMVPATEEWQVCFKCHSSYNTNQAGWVGTNYGGADLAIQLNPTFKSGHAVIGNSRVPADSPSNFVAGTPWNKSSILTCTDCHVNSNTGVNDPKGGHASKNPYMLRGNYQTTVASTATPSGQEMCGLCHTPQAYGLVPTDPGTGTYTNSGFSSGTNNMHLEHAYRQGISNYKCSMCHTASVHGSPRQAMFVLKTDPAPYNNGDPDKVGGFTRKANKTYQKTDCTGGAGGCSTHI